jgi:hypothetical protein
MTPLAFFEWLADTSWSVDLHESQYAYPLIESIHVWTMAVFFGSVVMFDLRLLGVTMRKVPASEVVDRLLPLTIAAGARGNAGAFLPAISCLGASPTPAARARGRHRHAGVRETCTGRELARVRQATSSTFSRPSKPRYTRPIARRGSLRCYGKTGASAHLVRTRITQQVARQKGDRHG